MRLQQLDSSKISCSRHGFLEHKHYGRNVHAPVRDTMYVLEVTRMHNKE